MALEKVKSFFSDTIESMLPVINDNLKSVTGNKIEASFGDIVQSGAENYIGENSLPFITIDISDKVTGCVHQAVISGDNAQTMSGFLGDEIDGELEEHHLDLFQNNFSKILGTFEKGGFKISNAEFITDSDNLNVAQNLLSHKLILRKGEKTIEMNVYHWESLSLDTSSENPEKVDFTAFSDGNKTSSTKNKIDMLLDVELEVTVELGRKKMSIQEVLKLGKGSVIELTKLAGEPIDIYVNQRKLAEGEVVVVDENFAIRITSLVEQSERLQSLG